MGNCKMVCFQQNKHNNNFEVIIDDLKVNDEDKDNSTIHTSNNFKVKEVVKIEYSDNLNNQDIENDKQYSVYCSTINNLKENESLYDENITNNLMKIGKKLQENRKTNLVKRNSKFFLCKNYEKIENIFEINQIKKIQKNFKIYLTNKLNTINLLSK